MLHSYSYYIIEGQTLGLSGQSVSGGCVSVIPQSLDVLLFFQAPHVRVFFSGPSRASLSSSVAIAGGTTPRPALLLHFPFVGT
jgi:hypothetical protein